MAHPFKGATREESYLEKDTDADRRIGIKPLKENNVSVARALFDSKKTPPSESCSG